MPSKSQKSPPKWNVNKFIDHTVTPYFPTQWLSCWILRNPAINHLTFTGAFKAARLMCWNAFWRHKILHGGLNLTHTERQPSLPFPTSEPATWSCILPSAALRRDCHLPYPSPHLRAKVGKTPKDTYVSWREQRMLMNKIHIQTHREIHMNVYRNTYINTYMNMYPDMNMHSYVPEAWPTNLSSSCAQRFFCIS